MSEKQVGNIMAKWAYIGVAAGLLANYAYLGVLKKDTQNLVIGSLFTFGGLALGSWIGAKEVEKLKEKL